MIQVKSFRYKPSEHEAEAASNSYLMSLVAATLGLPLPIFNLIATVIFYFNNKKSTYFVRWHCTQALLSQLSMLFINSCAFWWTIAVIMRETSCTKYYISYFILAVIINLFEVITTIYTAIKTRKGIHIEWWLFGTLTNNFCKE